MGAIHNGIETALSDDILLNKWKLESVYGATKAEKPDYCIFNNTYKALKLLDKHIKRNSTIVFHADVDVDGVGTTYIMKTALRYLGSNNHALLINRDKIHGVQQKHVEYFKDKSVDLIIITDSSSNDIEIIKQFNCDILCIDHHDLLHADLSGVCNNGVSEYVIVNNTIDSPTYDEDFAWLQSFDAKAFSNISRYTAQPAMSCGLVVYELLRVYCKYLGKEQLLENLKLYQWVGVTLFTDAVDTLNERNQWYLDNTVFSNEIEQNLFTMMRVINNFKATLDKSYIQYSFAPIINKAIRAGKSGEVIDKVVNNPSSICDLNIYNQYQVEAIDTATTITTVTEYGETKSPIAFTGDYILLEMSKEKVHPNYFGVIASRLCGDNKKSTAVYTLLPNGRYKGSFRGSHKGIDYRKYFDEYADDVYAQGHPPAFGFEVYPEQLTALMEGLKSIEPAEEDKNWITIGNNVDDAHKGIYHITDLDEFRKQGFIWKIAMGNAKVTSQDEILIGVSAKDVRLIETKGKVYTYDALGLQCKAFKPLEGDFFNIYIEYGREINIYIR